MGSVMANKIAMLIPCKESKMDYNERIAIIEKARELARKLKARFEVSFRVGIGSVKPQNQSIESYNEALNALIYTNGKVAHVVLFGSPEDEIDWTTFPVDPEEDDNDPEGGGDGSDSPSGVRSGEDSKRAPDALPAGAEERPHPLASGDS